MKWLYAAEMREFTTDEWLAEVAGLLSALSASEAVLLKRLRQVRRQMEATRSGPMPAWAVTESLSFDPGPPRRVLDAIPVDAQKESTVEESATDDPVGPSAEATVHARSPLWVTPPQKSWPGDAGENASAATSTTRSYDYFDELDEKLALLDQPGRGV